jgi:hypothetical protein
MNKLKWWLRIVGGFYALLALMNMNLVLFNPSAVSMMLGPTLPFVVTADTTMAFVDGWSPFAFVTLGIATFMFWALRNPRRYLGAVWLLVWLQLLHGVVTDIYLIVRGYSAVAFFSFIVVWIIIIVTGVSFVRQAEAEVA